MEVLQKLRYERELTQKEVAEKIGVSQVAYNRYERGERCPDVGTIKKIASFYGVSIDYLFGYDLNAESDALIEKNSIGKQPDSKIDLKKELEYFLRIITKNSIVVFEDNILTDKHKKILVLTLENILRIFQCIFPIKK